MESIIKKLSQIKLKDGIKKDKIFFGGSIKTFNIYEIDLDLLAYNHLNERIIIKKSEYEQTEGKSLSDLDVITRNNLIEDWIWNKDTNQNNTTKQSIKSKGQQRYGAVTSDGIIVSGNRRFTALRKLIQIGLTYVVPKLKHTEEREEEPRNFQIEVITSRSQVSEN